MLLFLFDPMDFDDDKRAIDIVFKDKDIAYKVAELHTLEKQNLSAFSHVFFDYGGFGLGNAMAEHFEQRVKDAADEYPDIIFCAILTMGNEWYKEVLKSPNVTSFQRSDLMDLPYYLKNNIGGL